MSDYTPQWFNARAARADADAMFMVPEIACATGTYPASVLDLGCGDGAMLCWWRRMGATSRVGVDQFGPDDWARDGQGLHVRHDLMQPLDLGRRFDLAVCLEVAEHLPESAADTLIDTIVTHSDRVVFSAAPPGQGGTGHLNEKPWEWWSEKWSARGWVAQDILRHRLDPRVSPWFRANTVLLSRHGHEVRVPNTAVTTARYRDCFRDIQDAMNRIATDVTLLPARYRANTFGMHELAYNACVDKMRSSLATKAIEDHNWIDFEYSLWIDADTVFDPMQAIDLVVAAAANNWDIATGLYTTKETTARIVHRVEGPSRALEFGPYTRPYSIPGLGIGFGFAVTRNDVFRRIALDPRSGVERTWFGEGEFVWDLFRPTLGDVRDDWICPDTGRLTAPYWNEDTAFSEKAARCGIPIWIHPQIFVKHRGRYDFGPQNLPKEAMR